MVENDLTELAEPLLPLHNGDELERHTVEEPPHISQDELRNDEDPSYEPFPQPPELTEIAERNVQTSFGIVFTDLVTKSIWNQNLLSVYVFFWDSDCIGIVQASMGLSQTLSCELAKLWTRHTSQPYSLVRVSIFVGISAMVVSIAAMSIIYFNYVSWQKCFVWFAVANALLGFFGGLLETTIPIVFVKSMSMLSPEKLQSVHGLHDKLALGSPIGTLIAILLFFLLGNAWTEKSCIPVFMTGLLGYLCIVVALCFVRPVQFDVTDRDEEEEWADARDCEQPSSTSDEEWFDPLPAEEGEEAGPTDDFTNTCAVDPLLRIEREESEAPNVDDRVSNRFDNATLVPMLIHTSDAVSSLASGISAWYLPVFLVQCLSTSPILLHLLYLVIPLGQKAAASIANRLAEFSGPSLACIIFQWCYILLLVGMTVCVDQNFHDWTVYILYFLHGSLMNSTSSLSLGMIASHVPFGDQDKWEFSPILQKVVWSSSGLLGSRLVYGYGIFANLYTTAIVQFLAGVPLVILYCTRNPPLEMDPNATGNDGDDGEQRNNQEKTNKATLIPSTPETESGVSDGGNWLV